MDDIKFVNLIKEDDSKHENKPKHCPKKGDTVIINNKHHVLFHENYLGEFKHELEKSQARHNLGIDKILTEFKTVIQEERDIDFTEIIEYIKENCVEIEECTEDQYREWLNEQKINPHVLYIITGQLKYEQLVDLELDDGSFWSTVNIASPLYRNDGESYAWGEIYPKDDYIQDNYSLWDVETTLYTKYTAAYDVLEEENDAANARVGQDWLIPTKELWEYLIDGTEASYDNEILTLTSIKNNNKIYIPIKPGQYYLSSTLSDDIDYFYAICLNEDSDGLEIIKRERYLDNLVRPVLIESSELPKSTYFYLNYSKYQSLSNLIAGSYIKIKDNIISASLPSVTNNYYGNGYSEQIKYILNITPSGYKSLKNKASNIIYNIVNYSCVDLKLPSGKLWATTNIGASSNYDNGNYYSWGELSTKNYYTKPYYSLYSNGSYTKYNSDDGLLELEREYNDIAYYNYGEGWQIPTYSDLLELQRNCRFELVTINNTPAFKITSNVNGNSIIVPSSGYESGGLLSKDNCYIQSNTIYQDGEDYDKYWVLEITDGTATLKQLDRYCGVPVRPIYYGSGFEPYFYLNGAKYIPGEGGGGSSEECNVIILSESDYDDKVNKGQISKQKIYITT